MGDGTGDFSGSGLKESVLEITVDCYRCSATIVVGLDDHTYENVLEKM